MERPHITVNCAASIDGKISTSRRTRLGLSDESDRTRVGELRSSCDAVAVGINTVLSDNPSLAVYGRGSDGAHPAKVVFDSKGRTPADARILDGGGKVYIVTEESCSRSVQGAAMLRCGRGRVDIPVALSKLKEEGIDSLLVEGGGEIIFEFARLGLIDRMFIYTAPLIVGGRGAPTVADGTGMDAESGFAPFRLVSVRAFGMGVLAEYVKGGKWRADGER